MTYDSVLPNRATVRTLSAALATAVAGAAIAIPLISSPTASASVYQSPGLSSGKTLSGVECLTRTKSADEPFGIVCPSPLMNSSLMP